jgi:hypothetical protein
MNYQRIYDQIIDRAKSRKLEGYREKHHIIPKCLGGTNEKQNLVELTAREHFVCHQLLIFIYPRSKKIAYALWGMCNQTTSLNNIRKYRVSSRAYQTGRESFIQAITGRTCTWGDAISKSKRGVSQGKRSKESIAKQKETVAKNPFRHLDKSRQNISNVHKGVPKSREHREAISVTNKLKGIKPPSQAKPVVVQGILYGSIKEACEALNIPRHILSKLLKNSCK